MGGVGATTPAPRSYSMMHSKPNMLFTAWLEGKNYPRTCEPPTCSNPAKSWRLIRCRSQNGTSCRSLTSSRLDHYNYDGTLQASTAMSRLMTLTLTTLKYSNYPEVMLLDPYPQSYMP